MEKLSYVYMMGSASRRALYTGITARLYERVWDHKNNRGGYFTAKYKCHRLVYFESYGDVIAAIAREKEIKGRRREKKNKLVESLNPDWKDLAEDWYPNGLLKKDGIPFDPTNDSSRSLGPTHALVTARARKDDPRDDEV